MCKSCKLLMAVFSVYVFSTTICTNNFFKLSLSPSVDIPYRSKIMMVFEEVKRERERRQREREREKKRERGRERERDRN